MPAGDRADGRRDGRRFDACAANHCVAMPDSVGEYPDGGKQESNRSVGLSIARKSDAPVQTTPLCLYPNLYPRLSPGGRKEGAKIKD